jgi:hypothetical protein
MNTLNRHSPEVQAEFDNLYQLIQKLENLIKELRTKLETK